VSAAIREAASVILLRRTAAGFELFFMRRVRGGAWGSACVFPGGATDEGEDARTAAVRELFEESGVLLAKAKPDAGETLEMPSQARLRKRMLAGEPASAVLDDAGLAWAPDALVPWSHWITPSIEPKRFSARFYVLELPPGQQPSHHVGEAVEMLWVTPEDALARAGELNLPPPQVRTCWELAEHADIRAVLAAGKARGDEPHPIMPRLKPGESPCLLLPWDPEYLTAGTGESTPLSYTPAWARGPSRFVRDGNAWKHVHAS
jgi:8-oxo-dGTP pyrophosphatase MutT (NUDIX family)